MLTANGIEEPWPRTLFAKPVPWIAQRADAQREAAASDAAIELIAETDQPLDAVVEVCSPFAGELCPVISSRGASIGELKQRPANGFKWNAGALRRLNDSHAAQHFTRVAALVSLVAPAMEEPFGFVKMEGGDGHTAAPRYLAYREFFCEAWMGWRHSIFLS